MLPYYLNLLIFSKTHLLNCFLLYKSVSCMTTAFCAKYIQLILRPGQTWYVIPIFSWLQPSVLDLQSKLSFEPPTTAKSRCFGVLCFGKSELLYVMFKSIKCTLPSTNKHQKREKNMYSELKKYSALRFHDLAKVETHYYQSNGNLSLATYQWSNNFGSILSL